jgi:hypothetical protein
METPVAGTFSRREEIWSTSDGSISVLEERFEMMFSNGSRWKVISVEESSNVFL